MNNMKDRNRLLVISENSKIYAEMITKLDFADLDFKACDNVEDAKKYVEDCNIILGEPARVAPVLDAAKRLQWFQSTWAGTDVLLSPNKRTDYVLTGVKGVFGSQISEYVFAYILALERNIFEVYENQKNRVWKNIPYEGLDERLIGVCGLGSIGRYVAKMAGNFGMKVWGYKRTYEEVTEVDRVFSETDFQEFLAKPDYIVITLPNTSKTFHLFDYDAFLTMKSSAVLINVGRGSVVDENSLIRALEEKLIGGAILDVFKKEPLPEESPLWSLPNVIITPHNSATSFPKDIIKIFTENYRRFVEKKPFQHVIEFSRGY
jgi:phosphoglycerate dehydrogenase-like enzyme